MHLRYLGSRSGGPGEAQHS